MLALEDLQNILDVFNLYKGHAGAINSLLGPFISSLLLCTPLTNLVRYMDRVDVQSCIGVVNRD